MNFPKAKKQYYYLLSIVFIFFLLLVLSFSLTACFNNDNNKKQTKPITKINQKNSQKQATTTSSTTDQTIEQENQSNYILKKVGTDKNGWNIYRSQKYGFEFKAPVEWEIERYGDDYVVFSFLPSKGLDKFYISFSNNFKQKIDSEKKYIQFKCKQAKNYKKCVNYFEKNIILDSFYTSDNCFVVNTKEETGINTESSIYNIFCQNKKITVGMDYLDQIKKGWGEEGQKIFSDNKRMQILKILIKSFKIIDK